MVKSLKKEKQLDSSKLNKFLIKDETYYCHVNLVIGGTVEKLDKYIYKKYGVLLEDDASGSCGMQFSFSYNDCTLYFIWIKDFHWSIAQQTVLAHEILHHTFEALQNAGMKYKASYSEEAYTYYFQNIMFGIWAKLANYR